MEVCPLPDAVISGDSPNSSWKCVVWRISTKSVGVSLATLITYIIWQVNFGPMLNECPNSADFAIVASSPKWSQPLLQTEEG